MTTSQKTSARDGVYHAGLVAELVCDSCSTMKNCYKTATKHRFLVRMESGIFSEIQNICISENITKLL